MWRPSEHVFRSSRLLDHDESQKKAILPAIIVLRKMEGTARQPLDFYIGLLHLLPYLRNPHRADANNVCRYIASHASLAPQIVL